MVSGDMNSEQRLRQERKPALRLPLLLDAARHALDRRLPDAQVYAVEACRLADQLRRPVELAEATRICGVAALRYCEYAEGAVLLRRALHLFESNGDVYGMGQTLRDLGSLHREHGEFAEAYRCYMEALDQDQDDRETVVLCCEIGALFLELRDYEQARVFLGRGETAANAHDAMEERGLLLHCKGYLLLRERKIRQALKMFLSAAQLFEETGNVYREILSLNGAILIELNDGLPDAALVHCVRARMLCRTLQLPALLVRINLAGMVLQQRLGDPEQALVLGEEGLTAAAQVPDKAYAAALHFFRGNLYRHLQRNNEAAEAYRAAVALESDTTNHFWRLRSARELAELLDDPSSLSAAAYRQFIEIVGEQRPNIGSLDGIDAFWNFGAGEKQRTIYRMAAREMSGQVEQQRAELTTHALRRLRVREQSQLFRERLRSISEGKDVPPETVEALRNLLTEFTTIMEEAGGEWEQFRYQFEMMNPDFIGRLSGRFPELTPAEQKVCVLIRTGLRSKEISDFLTLTVQSVEIYRSRIRRKLGLKREENLASFLASL